MKKPLSPVSWELAPWVNTARVQNRVVACLGGEVVLTNAVGLARRPVQPIYIATLRCSDASPLRIDRNIVTLREFFVVKHTHTKMTHTRSTYLYYICTR